MDTDRLVAHLHGILGPTRSGLLVCGSATRERNVLPGDVDIVVVTDEPWVQKIKQSWAGVALDIQIGPVRYYSGALVREKQSGMVQMFVTGAILSDPHGYASEVVVCAKRVLAQGPPKMPFELFYARQRCATLLDRSRRYSDTDPLVSQTLLGEALQVLVRISDISEGRWTLAFQDDIRRLRTHSKIGESLREMTSLQGDLALDRAEALLVAITGETIESSMYGSTPRIRIGGSAENATTMWGKVDD